jgi:hypothetical protein
VKRNVAKKVARRKRRVLKRLERARERRFIRGLDSTTVIGANSITYELSERCHAIGHGGIGMMIKLARNTGLIDAIDRRLHLLKVHAPYQESDHVMAHVLNMLCGGTRLEHLELLRMYWFSVSCENQCDGELRVEVVMRASWGLAPKPPGFIALRPLTSWVRCSNW